MSEGLYVPKVCLLGGSCPAITYNGFGACAVRCLEHFLSTRTQLYLLLSAASFFIYSKNTNFPEGGKL